MAACLSGLLLSGVVHAQIRMLPKAKMDKIVADAEKPREYCVDFLQFELLSIDAGTVKENAAPIQVHYSFLNKSKNAVSIAHPATSCDCTQAAIEGGIVRNGNNIIMPGKVASVRVTYYQMGHPGRHPRYITLHPSDYPDSVLARLCLFSLVTGQ